MRTSFDEIRNEKDLIILDGAMATELEKKGLDLNDELWSAKVLESQPQAISEVHYDYFKNGADAGTSASYQASIAGFLKKGYSEREAKDFIARSMELLLETRSRWWEEEGRSTGRCLPLAVGSIGPYGAYLADGSEYTGNYQVSEDELEAFHKDRMVILKEAGAELFALETFPCLYEAVVCARVMEQLKADYYISFSFKNSNQINGGDTIESCVKALGGLKHLKAIGVNCTQPHLVTDIIKTYKSHTNLPIVAYPNSGESYDACCKTWHGVKEPGLYGQWAARWYEAGAGLIGGCCRTTPEDIHEIFNWYQNNR
ncbi:homocysteine S-methyltransferase [Lacrimispora sp.]|uniref:homocysteine S-methyltransferase n=1 Tax=Lacrimispora sp. TaxID=2719234 RepID=UPI0032E4919E